MRKTRRPRAPRSAPDGGLPKTVRPSWRLRAIHWYDQHIFKKEMGLEKRGDKYYVYQKRRTPDGVVSEYLGTGSGAQSLVLAKELIKRMKRYQQEDRETLKEAVERADRALDEAAETTRALTSALLIGLGFYRHKYQWRRRRGVTSWHASEVPFPPVPASQDDPHTTLHSTPPPTMSSNPARPLGPNPSPDDAPDEEDPIGGDPTIGNYLDRDLGTSAYDTLGEVDFDESTIEMIKLSLRELRQGIERIEKMAPNQKSADAMREFLAYHPSIWRDAGFLSSAAAEMTATAIQPELEGDKQAILTLLDEIRVGLGHETSPPHERVLIDQVALALLSYRTTALLHSAFAFGPSKRPEHGAYWEERLGQTERRLQRAVKALARVRKLTRSTKAVQADLAAYLEGIAQANESGAGENAADESDADESDADEDAEDGKGNSTTGVATFEGRWQWGPREKVLTAAEVAKRAWKNPEYPWSRLAACHKYMPRTKRREALEEYADYLEEIFDEPKLLDFLDAPPASDENEQEGDPVESEDDNERGDAPESTKLKNADSENADSENDPERLDEAGAEPGAKAREDEQRGRPERDDS